MKEVVHPDDAEMFQEQVDLPLLQDTLFHSQQPEFYRFRKQMANQFVWITMEVLPCRGCCAQKPLGHRADAGGRTGQPAE